MSTLFNLRGKTAVVIGGAGALGLGIARAFAAHGAAVTLVDQPAWRAELEAHAAELGEGAMADSCDVTAEESLTELVDRVVAQAGRLDIVVNAAGRMLRKPFDETTREEFESIVEVNMTGTWLVNRAAGVRMRRQGSGRIINVSTVYADRVGPVPESAYYASKAGIANLTRSFAAELGAHGVTVNCLAPGVFYPTRMTGPLADDPERLEWFAKRTMLGRLGNPETDIGGPALLLASDAGAYITGQVLYIDGGWSAW